MKIEVKKIDGNIREINIEVGADIVEKKFDDVFKRISQEAKVPGFRPGHAPRDIIEKKFGTLANEEVLKELIPDVYNQAINRERLDVVELPQVSDVKLSRNNLSFKAKVEVMPEINLKDYKGIKINYKNIKVSSDEVKRNIDSFKEARKIESLDDNLARSLGYPTLLELEGVLEKQIYLNKESAQRQDLENQIVENLLKGVEFSLPQSMVKRQQEDMLRQAKLDLALKGIQREKIEGQQEKMLKDLEPEAKRQVKVYLILSSIAKRENIPVDEHMPRKTMEFLLKEADWKIAD
jgi:FKBP-type peptidyl-prolyl cis-trans isomerase (trigger factor)